MCSSGWDVGDLPDGCRRTEGRLSPTLAVKRRQLPTPKQKAALIGWNQVINDEEKKAWRAGRVIVASYTYLGVSNPGLQ